MIIKIILLVFIYLFIGVLVLEGLAWYDRKHPWEESWIEGHDDLDQAIAVLLWPLILILVTLGILFFGFVRFIKGIRVFYTTIIYLIIAIIDKDK